MTNYDLPDDEYAVHDHYDLPDNERVEVDYNGWKGDSAIFLEIFGRPEDDGNNAIVLLSPKKARKIGKSLVKAAKRARKNK